MVVLLYLFPARRTRDIVVYLYNFKVLPLERAPLPTAHLANLIGYANIGLAGFLVVSLCARFDYPAIGMEGEAFYVLRTSPLSLSIADQWLTGISLSVMVMAAVVVPWICLKNGLKKLRG